MPRLESRSSGARDAGNGFVWIEIAGQPHRITRLEYEDMMANGSPAPDTRGDAMKEDKLSQDLANMTREMDQYKPTAEEMQRIAYLQSNPDEMSRYDYPIVEKYNTYSAYYNQVNDLKIEKVKRDYESGADKYRDEEYKSREFTPMDWREMDLSSFNGELVDKWGVPIDQYPEETRDDIISGKLGEGAFIKFPGGVYPVNEPGRELLNDYTGESPNRNILSLSTNRLSEIDENLQGKALEAVGFLGYESMDAFKNIMQREGLTDIQETGVSQDGNVPTQYQNIFFNREEIPQGAMIGLPEGVDPSNYINIGFLNENMTPEELRSGMDSYSETDYGDRLWIRKYNALGEWRDVVNQGEMKPLEDVLPNLTDIKPMGVTDPTVYTEDLSQTEYGSDYDAYTGEELTTKDEETPATKDPVDWGNVLKAFASSLTPINMQGIQINIPNYRSPQYASPAIGPALQNYFRGK